MKYDDPTQEAPNVEDTLQIRNYHDMYMRSRYYWDTNFNESSPNFTDGGIACCLCKADEGDKYYGCMINTDGKIVYKTEAASSVNFEYAGSLACFTITGFTAESYIVNSTGKVVKVIEDSEKYSIDVDAAGYVILIDKDSKEAKVIDSTGNEVRTISGLRNDWVYCLGCGVILDGDKTLINLKTGKKMNIDADNAFYNQNAYYDGSSIFVMDKSNKLWSIDLSLNDKEMIYQKEGKRDLILYVDNNICCFHYVEGKGYKLIENIKTGDEIKLDKGMGVSVSTARTGKISVFFKGADGKTYYNLLDKDFKMIFDEPFEYDLLPFGDNYYYETEDHGYVLLNPNKEVIMESEDRCFLAPKSYKHGRGIVVELNETTSLGGSDSDEYIRFYYIDENGNEIKAYD